MWTIKQRQTLLKAVHMMEIKHPVPIEKVPYVAGPESICVSVILSTVQAAR